MHSHSNALLLVISAPSGGGKTTLCQQLLATMGNLRRAITCTTRSPRAGEENGKDYYFLPKEEFLRRINESHFLEHANVYGNLYGVLKSEVQEKLQNGNDVVLSVDVQGAASIKKEAQKDECLARCLVTTFLSPASFQLLEQRLRKRAQDSEEVIQQRLKAARAEIACWRDFDYFITSTTIEEDLRRMQAIIEAEKMRHSRMAPPDGI